MVEIKKVKFEIESYYYNEYIYNKIKTFKYLTRRFKSQKITQITEWAKKNKLLDNITIPASLNYFKGDYKREKDLDLIRKYASKLDLYVKYTILHK